MRIYILIPSFSGGGAERVGVNLANSISCTGNEVTVITFMDDGPYKNSVNDNVELVSFSSRNKFIQIFSLFVFLKRKNVENIISVIREGNLILGLCLYFCNVDKVCFREANTLHAIRKSNPIKRFLYFFLMRISYRNANKIIANSIDTRNDLINEKIAGKSKIKVIGNPVIPSNYFSLSAEKPKHKWFFDQNLKVVINIARLNKQKNHIFLLNSFSDVVKKDNNARLIIVGEGSERNKILDEISRLNINDFVDILNFQNNPYPLYKNCKVFVLSSDWEGFGNVLVEAMVCGANIVSTDCPGGPSTILKNGRLGWLVKIGDNKGYTKAILEAFESEKSTYSDRVSSAKYYTVENIKKEYMKAFLGDGR